MVASTLRAGNVAIVSYATDDGFNGNGDLIRFVALTQMEAGTVVYFTDRNWTPTAGSSTINDGSFAAAGGGEGTFTYTAGGTIAAGTVITITSAQLTTAGINLVGGDTIYVYQGTDANTPTEFLFAADIADGNTTFNGSLVNTGLAANVNVVAIAHDQAVYQYQGLQSASAQLGSIVNTAHWYGNDTDDLVANAYDDRIFIDRTGPLNTADVQIYGAMTGGGQADAIVRVDNDEAANVGTNLARLMRDNSAFISMEDIAFDVEDGVWFAVMNEGTDITRIVKGNIVDLLEDNETASFTTVFEYNNDAANSGDDKFIQGIELDKSANRIFFTLGDIIAGHEFRSIDYNGGSSRNWGPIDLEDGTTGFAGGIEDFVIDTANNTAYFSYVLVNAGAGVVEQNYVVKLTSLLNTAAPNPNVENFAIVNIANAGAPPVGYLPGRIPDHEGSIRGLDLDGSNLWFVTGRLGAAGTGGVFKLNLSTLVYTEVWQQPSNNAHNTPQAFPTTLLHDIEVDSIGGRYYLTDQSSTDHAFDGTPATDENGGNIWSGGLGDAVGTAPTLFADNFDPNGGATKGMEINYAPTSTGLVSANAGVTEASSAPGSGTTAVVQVGGAPTVNDVDTTNLKGAVVAITGFQPGDVLGFTNSGGITGSYNANTGVLTFTGSASYAQYATVLDSVTFSTSGDNPTDYGLSTSRTITFSVTDGLAYSDPATATVTVTGINDAPINVPGAAMSYTEDTTGNSGSAPPVNAVTGISVSDVDANPSTQDIRVTLAVANGTITIRTDVAGGIVAADITGGANGSGTIVITATQNQINKTLAAVNGSSQANGLVYTPNANFNGADTLTITTNDLGLNGNDSGNSGTGTTEEDSDGKTLNVTDVNDAPTVGGDGTEDSPTILEDTPYTNLNAPSVATLFGGQFSDALDDQDQGGANPTGTPGDTLAGIAVVANGSNANGNWQYWDGDSWENIGAASLDAAKTFTAATLIRFSPTLNFNGAAPTLTARLIETGGAAITNAGTVDLNPAPPTTGPTAVYSAGSVVLSQAITAVNDAPVNAVGGTTNATEDGGAVNVTGVSISDVDANPASDLVTVTLDVDRGTLAILTNVGGGIVAGDIVSQDADTIQITATINKINNTLAAAGGLTYTADADYNGGDTLEVITNDGGFTGQDPGLTGTPTSEEDIDSKTISVSAVADIANDTVNFAEDAGAQTLTLLANDSFENSNRSITAVGAALHGVATINDNGTPGNTTDDFVVYTQTADYNGTDSFTYTVTSGGVTEQATVNVTISAVVDIANDAVAVEEDSGANNLDLLANDSFEGSGRAITAVGSALHGTVAINNNGTAGNASDDFVVYTPTGNYHGADSFTYTVTSGGVTEQATANITVNAVNDPVTTAAPVSVSLNEDSVNFAVTGMSISDADAALTPAGVYVVTLSSTQGTMSLGAGTLAALTFSAGDGTSDSTMTFRGTLANINTALATATYTPTAHYAGPAQIQLQATDTFGGIVATGSGAATNDSDTIAVTVNQINDEPAGADKTLTIDEDVTHPFAAADFGFTDPLDGNILQDIIFTTLPSQGTIFLDADGAGPGNPVAVSANTPYSASYLDGRLTFFPGTEVSGTPFTTFTFQVRDDGGTANGGQNTDQSANTITFNVNAVNDVPEVDSPTTINGFEDVVLNLTNMFEVDDEEPGDITVEVKVTDGVLTLSSSAGLTSAVGSGTDTVTVVGDPATIQNVLNSSLSYLGPLNASGSRTLTIKGTDAQNATLTDTSDIVLAAVNDEPAGADNNDSVVEGNTHVFTVANFATGMTDVESHAFFGVRITTLPSSGLIFYDADGAGVNPPVAILAGTSYTAQDLTDGKLTYVPAPASAGTSPTFTFQVRDAGGVANGGVNLDQSPNTFTINVTSPQDSPVINDLAGDTSAFTEGGSAVLLDDSSLPELAATVTDTDSADFNGGALTVSTTGNEVAAEDVLGISTGGTVTLSNGTNVGSVVSVGGQAIGTVSSNGSGGNNLVVAFDTANATPANVSALVQALTYSNTNTANPSTAQRTIAVTVSDGDGGSDSENVLVNVSATNDPPVVTLQDATVSGTEDVNLVFNAANSNAITVADVDNATLTVTLTVLNGRLTLAQTTGLSVTGDGTATVELTGSAANINAALEGLVYRGNLNYEGSDTLGVEADDGTATDDENIAITLADDGIIHGDSGNNTLTGTPQPDLFMVQQGGNDSVDGLGDRDVFYFGNAFTAADTVVGGAGVDSLVLQGNYSAGITFGNLGVSNLTGVESISLMSGGNTGFGDTAGNLYSYNLVTLDGNVDAGAVVRINGAHLAAGENLTFNGGAELNGSFLVYGGLGTDTLTGGGQGDVFVFNHSGRFAAGDTVNGGGGYDVVYLRGNYTIDLTQAGYAGAFTSIESLQLQSASDTSYAGGGGSEFDYNIVFDDALLAAAGTLTVNGSHLTAGESLSFDGTDEASGKIRIFSGAGTDVLRGGGGNDLLFGNLGPDTLQGGGGADVFRYQTAADSTSAGQDGIQDFTDADLIDLSKIDAIDGTPANDAFSFIGSGPFTNQAGQLRAVESSPGSGLWTVFGDTNGDNNADFQVSVTVTDAHILGISDFVL